MSSISRRRNGLMALSVIGAPVLGEVFSPSISRQDACFCYSPRPFPCYKYRGSGLDAMGRAARRWHHRRCNRPMERLMPQPNDSSRSLVALDQDSTLIAVIEMGQASWLVAGIVPGINRHPLKKIATDQEQ